jgi:signal transduction histidine kinase
MRRSGILVFDPTTRLSTVLFGDSSRPDNIYGHSVNDLQCGPDGKIYFTCRNDMYEVNSTNYRYIKYAVQDSSGQIAITKISPRSMVFPQQGQLLAASNLQVLLLQNGQWQNRYPPNGYSSFLIDKMTRDASDNIFIYTAGSVLKTDPALRSFANLQQLVGNSIATVTDIHQHDDSTWLLAQHGGLGILKTLDTEQRRTAPAPIISRVKYGSTEQYPLQRQSNPLRLHFQDALEIDIASPALTNHENCQLLYRLDGIDTAWKELLQTSTVRYDQLSPGHYTFMAKTLEPDGITSSVTSFQFQIVPPFYRTTWFLLLAAAAAFAAAFLYFRLQLQKALAIEKMRTKLATDLHDDIGATLSSIAMYSEAVQKQVNPTLPHLEPVLQKMADSSRTMVTAMSDIVWAINPANDAGDKLLQRMENYARDLCALKEIPLSFTATDKLPAIRLTLEQRRNIYLIFKEALNNALKYAGASNIRINFAEYGKAWQLIIADDGIGFETSQQNTGNGLKNMQKRAKEIDGQLYIESTVGKGTSINLLFYT